MQIIKDEEKSTTKGKANRVETEVPKLEGSVGIRATLKNMGFSDREIGYDDRSGTVTLNGKTFMKPTYLDNEAGVSYAPASKIQESLVNYYKSSSNPIVRVSDAFATAAGKYGLGADALSYGNGTVSIGGKPLETLYIDDSGKAWAWQDDVNSLTEMYANTIGVQSADEVAQKYSDKYLSEVIDRINALENREAFSYNPDDDPVYLAYRDKYITEGNRASQSAIADYSANTGGYVNSAAVTAGAMANQYWAGQLANTVPALAEMAYQRYRDSYQSELDMIDRLIDAYEVEYKTAADVNKQMVNNANYSAAAAVQRDNDAYERAQSEFERYWKGLQNEQDYNTQERENYWNEQFNPIELEQSILKNTALGLDNEQQKVYSEYYRRLLEGKLEGMELGNEKTRTEIQKILSTIWQ
ncbi:MAG: hypothetical protein IJA16_03335 [Clostridia bacterium]|nr:hypothetical protein [Clostridia bacterium]